jgi:hypothetical protein
MKTFASVSCTLLLMVLVLWIPVQAQYPEDALRLATPSYGVGSRALGMGNAYTGVASDYSALSWNPAGLAQLHDGEFSFGLSQLGNKNSSTFFGTTDPSSNSATNLNTLGLVYPVPARRGNLVFAFGFSRQTNFTGGVQFDGFNSASSYIQSQAPNGGYYANDLSGNIPYQLFLADLDTMTGKFISPITGRVNQSGTVTEKGGLNNWSVGAAIDVAKDVSVGVTLTHVTGSYRYDRDYEETDPGNVHNTFPYDFKRLAITEYVEDDISGLNARFGVMFRSSSGFRFGMTAKTPTSFNINETWSSSARSYFDNGDVRPTSGPFESTGESEYDVHTPWVLGVGASMTFGSLLLSADGEYTDWTQLEFTKGNEDVLSWNRDMQKLFRDDAWNLRAGAELEIPGSPVRLRGGFIYNTSPYKTDPSTFDQKFITGGLGIQVGDATMLDFAYARGWWDTYRYNYDASSKTNESITTNTILVTLSHRF